jgi:hypothetical protein
MNYTELKTNIQDICENSFTDDQLAMFTQQAEQKIYNTVQIPALRKNVTGTMSINVKYLSTPSDFLWSYSLAVVDGSGNYHFLLNKDVNFMREAYPNAYFEDGSHTDYPTNPDALREKRYDGKKFAQLGSTNNSNLHPKKLVLKYSAKKFFSVSSMKDNLTTHGATTTSNPIKNAFLYIHLLNMYDGLKNFDPSEVFVNVNIQYTALMFDRRTVAQS